jgi:hypothetical protein
MNKIGYFNITDRASIFPYLIDHHSKIVNTTLALSSLTYSIFSYQYPFTSTLITISATFVSLYSFPILISSSKSLSWLSTAFATHCAVLGIVLTGLSMTFNYIIYNQICSTLKSPEMDLKKLVTFGFLLTTNLGYFFWFAFHTLQRASLTYTNIEWNNQLQQIQEAWQLLKQTKWTLIERIQILSFLIFPEQAPQIILKLFPFTSSQLLAGFSPFLSLTKLFWSTYQTIRDYKDNYQDTPCPEPYKESLYNLLRSSLEALNEEEKRRAQLEIRNNMHLLVPHMMTSTQFFELFPTGERERGREELQELSKKINLPKFENYQEIHADLLIKAEEIKNKYNYFEIKYFEEELNHLKSRFLDLKKEIHTIYLCKQKWSNIYRHFSFKEQDILFLTQYDLSIFLHTFYQRLLSEEKGTLFDQIQSLSRSLDKRKKEELNQNNDREIDSTETYIFLGSHCEFKSDDYVFLSEVLQINLVNIQEKLEKIGLNTAEDLYKNKILPRPGAGTLPLTKEAIKVNLISYIQPACLTTLSLKEGKEAYKISSSIRMQLLSQKISKVLYRLFKTGLVFVPLCSSPLTGGIGFGIGLIAFPIKKWIKSNGILPRQVNTASELGPIFTNRRIILLSSNTHRLVKSFVGGDFFCKMRIISYDLIPTSSICYKDIGPLLQGLALAEEIIEITTSTRTVLN